MGKKLLFTFLIAFSFAFNSTSQTILLFADSGTVVNGTPLTAQDTVNGDTITFAEFFRATDFDKSFNHKEFISVYNNTPNPMVMKLRRFEEQIVQNSYDFYCFGQTCLGQVKAGVEPFRTSDDTLNVAPMSTANQSTPFTVYIDSIQSGVAIYKYEFYNASNPRDVGTFFLKWDVKNVTSLNEVELNNDFSIFPNPASDVATLNFEKTLVFNQQEIVIYNILGEEIKSERIESGLKSVNVDVTDFTPGIYFVNVIANGANIGSKKMIVR